MDRYTYDGPVVVFGTCVANHWKGETMAVSPKKAKSNLIFQFKKSTNRASATKVELPGTVVKGD